MLTCLIGINAFDTIRLPSKETYEMVFLDPHLSFPLPAAILHENQSSHSWGKLPLVFRNKRSCWMTPTLANTFPAFVQAAMINTVIIVALSKGL